MSEELLKRIEKLPRWARDHIRDLERQRDAADWMLRQHLQTVDKRPDAQGRVSIETRLDSSRSYLNDRATIRFNVGDLDDYQDDIHIYHSERPGHLELYASMGRLCINPQATNSLLLSLSKL